MLIRGDPERGVRERGYRGITGAHHGHDVAGAKQVPAKDTAWHGLIWSTLTYAYPVYSLPYPYPSVSIQVRFTPTLFRPHLSRLTNPYNPFVWTPLLT